MSRGYRTFDRSSRLQSIPESPSSRSSAPGSRRFHHNRSPHHQDEGDNSTEDSPGEARSPLPTRQLFILAVISLAEQTAFNSIAPYLPHMAATLTSTTPSASSLIGLYVGIIASTFASAQFLTNFLWGWLSDRIGRKPVILIGAFLTAVCFVLFGLCRRLWQVIVVQALMGVVNGNAGLVPTCLGEITDRSNQSTAFTYLPIIYGVGAIIGPVLGGALAPSDTHGKKFPFLVPNLVVAGLLIVEFLITAIYLDESLESSGAIDLGGVWRRIESHFVRLWEFSTAPKPHYLRVNQQASEPSDSRGARAGRLQGHWTDPIEGTDTASDGSEASSTCTPLFSDERGNGDHAFHYTVPRKDIVLIFTTYAIFQLSHVSFNSLYPVFSQGPAPLGRDLTPNEIGMSLGFAGVMTIVFQIFVFEPFRGMLGNRNTYQLSLFLLILPFILMPCVGYKTGQDSPDTSSNLDEAWVFLAVEVCCILLLKTIATVSGLTSSLLLITNSAPTHKTLGSLNGVAQTLSAAGRGIGPIFSGGLFSLVHKIDHGAFVAFGTFAAIALIGFVLSLGIRSGALEDGHDQNQETHASGD